MFTQTLFICVRLSTASSPFSRPNPLDLYPPNGAFLPPVNRSFTNTPPGLNVARAPVCTPDVTREDSGHESVLDTVREVDRIPFVGELDYGEYRTEDLLLCDPTPVVDIVENSRFEEVPGAVE